MWLIYRKNVQLLEKESMAKWMNSSSAPHWRSGTEKEEGPEKAPPHPTAQNRVGHRHWVPFYITSHLPCTCPFLKSTAL